MLALVPYDRVFLDLSWEWLSDPEIKQLTLSADFSRTDQQRFFDALPNRPDYRIWGVTRPNYGPIGAAGLKKPRGATAEYWGYIGDRNCWGRGLGREMIRLVEAQAIALGLAALDLRVGRANARAMRLYSSLGYAVIGQDEQVVTMLKQLVPSAPADSDVVA